MKDVKSEFNRRIDAGYKAYRRELKDMGNSELIEKAKDIAAMQNLYETLKQHEPSLAQMEYLLKFKNPLEIIYDEFIVSPSDIADDVEYVLWNIADKQDAEELYELVEGNGEPENDGEMEM